MDERIGKRGWRIWSSLTLPQDAVPLGDAEGVVAQLEAELKRANDYLNQTPSLGTIRKLEAENAKLREALEFVAHPRFTVAPDRMLVYFMSKEEVKKARKALDCQHSVVLGSHECQECGEALF